MATEIVIKNILDNTVTNGKGRYEAFKNQYVAFVFKYFTGLLAVNSIELANITSSTSYIEVNTSPHRIKFETLNGTWSVLTGSPSPYVAKYIYNSDTYIVVFGTVNANGIPNTTVGTCGTDVYLSVDELNVPSSIYGCRVDGKPVRNDCAPVSSLYTLGGGLAAGEVPV
jgi:hypothetical protein